MSQTQTQPRGAKLTPKQAMDLAFQHYKTGALDKAHNVLASILKAAPKNPDALHLMGVISQARGNDEEAAKLIVTALKIAPRHPQYLTNLTEVLRRLGKYENAIQAGQDAVKSAPNSAVAHSNLGVAYYDNEDLDNAEACQRKALSLKPDLPQALNNLASIHRDREDTDAAKELYTKAVAADPNYHEGANNLASVHLETEDHEAALKVLLPLIKRKPDYAEAHKNIGRAFFMKNDLDRAEFAFRKAREIKPDLVEAVTGLAQIMQEKNQSEMALELAREAAELAPDKAHCQHQLGVCLADAGLVDDAIKAYDRAIELDSEFAPGYLARGHLTMEHGDIEAAKAEFQHAIDLKPEEISGYLALARAEKITGDNPIFKTLESHLDKVDAMSDRKAVAYHYGMGKCYEDQKQHDAAFTHYKKGADTKRGLVSYDPARNDRNTDRTIKIFSSDYLEKLRSQALPSQQPIFVLGMPRSGTTLTESILASHPDVFGAGELNELQKVFRLDESKGEKAYPDIMKSLSDDEVGRRMRTFLDRLDTYSPGSPRITDKMPANFIYLGLIHAVLPNAKIIHTHRNPLDTCLSCYTRLFERSQYHSYDLTELGRYYRNYRRLMDHWSAVLPEGSFKTVVYEDLVADTEGEARQMLEFCELDWTDNVLEFHKEKRRVRTASVTQVRQPIYKTSMEKWRAYEEHLGPLIEAIGPENLPEGL